MAVRGTEAGVEVSGSGQVLQAAPVEAGAPPVADRQRSAFLVDLALAALLTVFAQLNLRLNIDQSQHYGPEWAAAVATLVATGALAFRRRAPLGTAIAVAAALALPELGGVLTITLWGDFVPWLVAAYSVARHADRRRAAVGLAVLVASFGIIWLRVPSVRSVSNIPFNLVPLVVVVAVGRVLRRRQRSHAALSMEARRLAEDQATWVADAVAAERARIARELHDVVAHCVSVMVIQAGAAEDLLDRDPAAARRPLRAVQDTGQQAVAELGRMLGLLRGSPGEETLVPQPGTARLPELLDQVRAAGLAVEFDVAGTPKELPPGVDVTLYRLTQEALTNALKHARGTRVAVVLRYSEAAVELSVSDNGRGDGGGPGQGHGLIGMRERVALYGGTLSAGRRESGGFAVDAVLPLDVVGRAAPA